MLTIKRIYDPPSKTDSQRVLIDRIWPRGVSKEEAALTLWLKEIAPTTALRQWFHHDPTQWDGFRARYRAELDANPEPVAQLRDLMRHGDVTLLYSARDRTHNQAQVLADYMDEHA